MLTAKIKNVKKILVLLMVSIILAISLNQSVVLAAVANDAVKAVAALIKSLGQSKSLLQEHQILLRQIGSKVDDFIQYLSSYPKDQRIVVLLGAAEQKGLIKSTEKLRWNHDILNEKIDEDDLIEMLRSNQSSDEVMKSVNMMIPKIKHDNLSSEARETLKLIDNGNPFPYAQDGTVFHNREGKLPTKSPHYYHEYTVKSSDSNGREAQIIITGENGVKYFTDDHYQSFKEIKP